MSKLVAFYSRADENYFGGQYRYIEKGNTEKIAEFVAEAVSAELFKIEQKKPYSPEYQKCIEEAKEDLERKVRPQLVCLPKNLDAYDEIYLGYPNYWGTMPMAVYSFLEAYDWNGKAIHPFCTHEGSGLSDTVREIQKICVGATVSEGLAVTGSVVNNAKNAVTAWLKKEWKL